LTCIESSHKTKPAHHCSAKRGSTRQRSGMPPPPAAAAAAAASAAAAAAAAAALLGCFDDLWLFTMEGGGLTTITADCFVSNTILVVV